ncbi:MAG: FtsX-like permease family protein [Candidatus Hermodarchaeota archaeon]
MAFYLKIAFRNMKRRKSRFILTTITLIIGVALFGGILITNDSLGEFFVNSLDDQYGSADILMRNDNSSDGWFDSIELDGIMDEIRDIDSISYRIAGFGVFLSDTDKGNQIENSTYTAVYGIDIKDTAEKKLGKDPEIIETIVEGDSIEDLLDHNNIETGDKVLVISEALKYYLGNIHAGDNVWVLPKDGEKTINADLENTGTWIKYTIVAIVRDSGEAVDFDPKTISDEDSEDYDEKVLVSQGPCIFVNIINAHELVDGIDGATGDYNLAVIGVNNIRNIAHVKKIIEGKYEASGWVICDLKSGILYEIESSVGVLIIMLMMFALIALILSIVLIMNIFDVIKKEQEYETGMYQAIGVSKMESFKLFLCQGLIIGIFGSIIGTFCSILVSDFLFNVSQDMMTEGSPNSIKDYGIVLYPNTLIITFIIGLVTSILASIYPSWKATRKPIIECLNPHAENINKKHRTTNRRKIYWFASLFLLISGVSMMIIGSVNSVKGEGQITTPTAGESTTMMMSSTFVLLGFIALMALIINPLIKIISTVFLPYLRQTRELTQKNILRNRKRTTLTFSMVALTLSFLIGMTILFDSMNAGFVYTADDMLGCDIQLYTGNTPIDFKEDLLEYEEIDNVMGVKSIEAFIRNQNEWAGHNDKIIANIMDMDSWKRSIDKISIIKSNGLSTHEIMDKLNEGYNTFITEALAEELDIQIEDIIEVNFSIGKEYANQSAILEDNRFNSKNTYVLSNFTVIAIVKNAPGFSSSGFDVVRKLYDIFVSWKTYEKIALKELPGNGIDVILRKQPETGDTQFDNMYPEWFNISEVMPVLDDISGIQNYTTRMEYATGTQVGEVIDTDIAVVGIRNDSYGKLLSDNLFGSHTVLEKSELYIGNSMEELLSTYENVCVVHQYYINEQIERGYTNFGIGSEVIIYSDQMVPHNFTIIGILENPLLHNSERFNWYVGYEIGVDILETEKTIYINYDKARELIYTTHQGSDALNDEVTSLLIRCEDPTQIQQITQQLEINLENIVGGNWSIVDLKTRTLEHRYDIYQWFIWLKEGEKDEEVLKILSDYIESSGIILFSSVTKTFILKSFGTVMDYITTIISGVLIFAIIISMIGLTLHCLVSTMSRRREIGMLRSIGLTKGGVVRTISGETILVAALGSVVGTIGGLLLGILLTMYGPGTTFVAFKLAISWIKIWIIILITLLTTLLGSVFTSRWAANINIIEATRTR